MSRPSSVVFVFEEESSTKPIEETFAQQLRPYAGPDGNPGFKVPDLHCAFRVNKTGFGILFIYFSGHFEYAHPTEYGLFLERLANIGKQMGATFAFVSEHDGQLEDRWLENEIFSPILAENKIEQERIGTKAIVLPYQ